MNQLIKNLVFTNIKLEWIPIKWWQLITEKLKTSLYSQEHTKYLNSNFSIIHVLLNLHPTFHQHMETWPSTQSSPRDEIYTTWIYLYTSKCLFHYFNLVIIFYFVYLHLTIHLFYLYVHLFYYLQSFTTHKDMLDHAIMRYVSGDNSTEVGVNLQQFPYPCYIED